MTPQQLWEEYKKMNPQAGDDYDAWAFGVLPDELAQLVLEGKKTATTSGYDFYALDNEPLPEPGSYDVVLDSKDQAVCIIKVTKVYVTTFDEVTADHAYKEGEGDRSLDHWRKVHEEVFRPWYEEVGLTFNGQSLMVCEEFEVVYPVPNQD